MASGATLTQLALNQLLQEAVDSQAPASLRPGDSPRLLGDLRLATFEAGETLDVVGIHRRDRLPVPGSSATLSILLGHELLALDVELQAVHPRDGETAMLRLSWPLDARLHRRSDIRVAAPDQAPLHAEVELGGQRLDALLVNLTETGVGLAFQGVLMVDLHASLEIDAMLPGGIPLRCPAEVRHLTVLEGQDYPTRLGVVLHPRAESDLDLVRQFIQARRTDRSQSFRQA
ncbi:MAG TPA: PilZ domain-containing protein [Holophagaceae bacterium]